MLRDLIAFIESPIDRRRLAHEGDTPAFNLHSPSYQNLSRYAAKRDRAWLDGQPASIDIMSFGPRLPRTEAHDLRSIILASHRIQVTAFLPREAKRGASGQRYRLAVRAVLDQPRKDTLAIKTGTRKLLHLDREASDQTHALYGHMRPKTRGDCKNGIRPCPWFACEHNLYLDVNPETGSITMNFPDRDFTELRDTCAADVGDRGEHTLEEVGEHMNLTRERVRQIELIAAQHAREDARVRRLAEDLGISTGADPTS